MPNLCVNVCSSFVLNNPRLEGTQMSFRRRMAHTLRRTHTTYSAQRGEVGVMSLARTGLRRE